MTKRKYMISALLFCACLIAASSGALTDGAKKKAGAKKKVFLVSHSHYDPVWTSTQGGETLREFAVLHQQIEYGELEPRFNFELAEVDYLKPYWDAYPADRARLLKLVGEGRVEFTSGYNEPDESSVSGEALIRNFQFGALYKQAEFGARVVTAAQHDVFGHAPQLPQILLGTGHKYAIFQRGNYTNMPLDYRWLAPDGSTILTKMISYVGNSGTASLSSGETGYYSLTPNSLFMSAGDFEEPDRSISIRIKNKTTYELVSAKISDFFDAEEKSLAESGMVAPEVSRDQNPIFNGCYTSRSDTKAANRRLENLLYEAEFFGTIDGIINGAAYPWAALDFAWRQLLFGEHHDGLTASDTENVNLDLLAGWHAGAAAAFESRNTAAASIAKSVNTAAGAPKTAGAAPIVVFNQLNWKRTEAAEAVVRFAKPVAAFKVIDGDGKPALFQLAGSGAKPPYREARVIFEARDVPPMGYAVYYAVPTKSFTAGAVPAESAGVAIENAYYRVEADASRGGGLKSIYDKKSGRELIRNTDHPGNEIYAVREHQKGSSPWTLNSDGKYWSTGESPAKSVKVRRGALCDMIVSTTAPRSERAAGPDSELMEVLPEIVRETRLCKTGGPVAFTTYINGFKGHDILFKAGFTASTGNSAPVFEERFATVTRPRNGVFMKHSGAGPDIDREYPSYNWHGLSPAASFSFGGAQYPLVFGEIVAPKKDSRALAAANRLAAALAKSGVTTTVAYDSDAEYEGLYGFRILLGYGGNNARTEELLKKLDPMVAGKFRYLAEGDTTMVFATPPASGETKPAPSLIVESGSAETLDVQVDKMAAQLGTVGDIELPADMNATEYREPMDNVGLALINAGNSGTSVEPDGTITVSLMRSSTGFPAGNDYTENWELEHWTRVFHYALLPLAGGWENANAPRAGYAFNFPLIAVQTGLHGGKLTGARRSFADTGDANAIVTTFKPAGWPEITNPGGSPATNRIIVRMYNPGTHATAGVFSARFGIAAANESDMLDNAGSALKVTANSAPVELGPFKIRTYSFEVGGGKDLFAAAVAKNVRKAPLEARYWQTNEGAAPMGFMPVAIAVEPEGYEDGGRTLVARVTVASNLKEGRAKGEVKFDVPAGAKVTGGAAYDLAPKETRAFVVRIGNLDPVKLTRGFVAARIGSDGAAYEDVLTFSNWRVKEGDDPSWSDPALDDSGWKSVPLARFWSSAGRGAGVAWYRKKIFIPKGMTNYQMLFERPDGATITVYINGNLARTDVHGRQYKPNVERKYIIEDGENMIAVRCEQGAEAAPMWGMAFRGAEAVFNREYASLSPGEVVVKRGGEAAFSVNLRNPFGQKVVGRAVLVSPIGTWSEGGMFSHIEAGPRQSEFELAPGGSGKLNFKVSAPPDALPGSEVAMVKIIMKGIAVYTDTVHIKIQ